jgi:hypothetical protein
MFPTEISNLPGQIEAALQFLRFTEEIVSPKNYSGPPISGRELTKTEFEVKDSALNPQPFDDMGFVDPPETYAEPDYGGDHDYEEDARERELLMDEIADYNDDFSRSNDEGWFYSDEG